MLYELKGEIMHTNVSFVKIKISLCHGQLFNIPRFSFCYYSRVLEPITDTIRVCLCLGWCNHDCNRDYSTM